VAGLVLCHVARSIPAQRTRPLADFGLRALFRFHFSRNPLINSYVAINFKCL
jgi:hypothetical protein